MRLEKRYGGDYATEFGPHPKGYPRTWSVHHIIDGKRVVGECHIEPSYPGQKYMAYTTTSGFIGTFRARRDMYFAIARSNN